MDTSVDERIAHARSTIRQLESYIAELEAESAGYQEYRLDVSVLEVYWVRAKSEEEAREMWVEGQIFGAPERHYQEIEVELA